MSIQSVVGALNMKPYHMPFYLEITHFIGNVLCRSVPPSRCTYLLITAALHLTLEIDSLAQCVLPTKLIVLSGANSGFWVFCHPARFGGGFVLQVYKRSLSRLIVGSD